MSILVEEKNRNEEKVGMNKEDTPLGEFQETLHEATELLSYPAEVFHFLKNPMRFFEVSIPVQMDDGETKIFQGYRAQHNDACGPTKGGIRFHPDVTPEEVKALSGWMSLKCGINHLPYGGAKGGIICDPRNLSSNELQRLSRGYVRAISQFVGPTKDIPAPDMYTNAQIMGWMLDEYNHICEYGAPGFITGKPLVLGGSKGRETATSKGVLYILQLVCEQQNLNIQDMRVIIQGFGNVGSYLAQYLYDLGAKIVGIADAKGAIYDSAGIDIPYLMENKDAYGVVSTLFRQTMTNEELLEQECDVLIPAAIGGVITSENADRLKCRFIVEAANGPTTKEAIELLDKEGIQVVPDVLANSGGVIVSYFEWCQNLQGYYWTEELVDQRLKERLTESFNDLMEIVSEYGVNMKVAAYILGTKRLAEASHSRGWININE